ncbi:unnamed protein product [Closterium sp. Naga37s-1]|nr:unnamed protein product [Closterium sp. Naga37s-1]
MTLLGGLRRGYVPVRRRNPSGGLQSSRQISLSDGTRRRQLRGRDRQAEEEAFESTQKDPSGGPQSGRQISPSDGTRRRQLRGRDRQAEEEDGEAGMTEAGMTEAGMTEAGMTEAGMTEAGMTEAGMTEAGVTEAGVTEAGKSKTSPELYYNGGAVIMDPVVYLIYYGTWPENSGAAVIKNFVQSLGGNASRQGGPRGESSVSDWWAITTHYFMTGADRKLAYVTPKVAAPCVLLDTRNPFLDRPDFIAFLPSIHTRPSGHPSCFLPPNHFAVVDRNVGKANRLPSDPSGIYIVTTRVPSVVDRNVGKANRLPSDPIVDRNVGKANRLPSDPSGIYIVTNLVDRNVGKANRLPSDPSGICIVVTIVDRNVGKANRLPSDPNGIYIVVTSADVDVWEFSRCSYCGWHAQMMDMRSGSPVAYAFVGHHSLCCQYSNSSPNGLPANDSLVSTTAHETTEAAADHSSLLNPRISLPPPAPQIPPHLTGSSSPNGLPAIDSMVSRAPSPTRSPRLLTLPAKPSATLPLPPRSSSPNGLPAIDSMVSTIAHETTEATTDSSPNGLPAIDSMLCRPKLCRPKLCRPKLRCSKLCRPKLCRTELCRPELCRPKLCRPELCCP